MGLVTAKEVAKAINLDKLGFIGTFTGWILMKLLNISTLNKVYDKHKHLNDLEFVNALIEEFEVNFEIPEEDLKRIPKTGAFITISNHPLGGIDGILLLKLLLEHRADFKIIANTVVPALETTHVHPATQIMDFVVRRRARPCSNRITVAKRMTQLEVAGCRYDVPHFLRGHGNQSL